jgi:hypothetical protein
MHLAGVRWARIGEQVGHDDTTTARIYTHVLVTEDEIDYATVLGYQRGVGIGFVIGGALRGCRLLATIVEQVPPVAIRATEVSSFSEPPSLPVCVRFHLSLRGTRTTPSR